VDGIVENILPHVGPGLGKALENALQPKPSSQLPPGAGVSGGPTSPPGATPPSGVPPSPDLAVLEPILTQQFGGDLQAMAFAYGNGQIALSEEQDAVLRSRFPDLPPSHPVEPGSMPEVTG